MNIPGYQIIELIKRKAGEERFLATQPSSGRAVVITCLAKSLFNQTCLNNLSKQLFSEAERACYLDHPNIAKLHEVGERGEFIYSVTDYVPGDKLPARATRMCLLDKIYVIKQLAVALDYLAERNMGHYNIQPGNILLSTQTSQAVLMDFGLPWHLYAAADPVVREAQSLAADYASPELLESAAKIDGRADLYSLGAVFCYLLTGVAPFKTGVEAVGTQHVGVSFVELPAPLSLFQSFIDCALAKTPQERFQSGTEMVEALDKVDDEAILTLEGYQPAPGSVDKPPRPSSAIAMKTNVVPLATVFNKRKVDFDKLLSPKEVPPAPRSDEAEALRKTWQDVPPTLFNNSYELPETKQRGVHARRGGNVRYLAKGKGVSRQLATDKTTGGVTATAPAGSARKPQTEPTSRQNTGENAAVTVNSAPKKGYQCPIEGPWAALPPDIRRSHGARRRTLLLTLLLAVSVACYSYYQ